MHRTRSLTALAVLTLVSTPLAAQWTQGAFGKIWFKSALFWQKTDQEFSIDGERRTRIGGGESNARAIFTDIIVGIRPDIDVWVQIPFFDFDFTDPAQNLQKTGFGDVRAWVRWQFFGRGKSTPIALRVGAKAPIGDSPIDAQIIPLGEGQWDVEFIGEIGHSFWPAPIYAEVWLGYRARFENTTTRKDPGGEYLYLAEVGVQPTTHSLLKATFDGLFARALKSEGLVTGNKRRIATLQFAGAWRVGPIWPEIGIRIPLSGREFPAGPQFVGGFSTQIR